MEFNVIKRLTKFAGVKPRFGNCRRLQYVFNKQSGTRCVDKGEDGMDYDLGLRSAGRGSLTGTLACWRRVYERWSCRSLFFRSYNKQAPLKLLAVHQQARGLGKLCSVPVRLGCFRFLVFLSLAGAIQGVHAGVERQQPNVILIITDDQGYGDLHCHGNEIIQTPNLDQLHAQSVRLTNFHTDPTCSPTRSALMTGRYSTRVGVWHTVMGRHMPRPDEIMMPQIFADRGYKTAMFGKWHLGDSYPFRPQDRGFQEVLAHGGGGIGQIPDYWGNDYFDDTYFHNGRPQKFTGYCTDVFFRAATEFISSNRDRPFFAYISTNAPHSPFRVSESYSSLYEDQFPENSDRAKFYGMITNLDENVGRLVQVLKDLDLADNTILIFMTDNGTSGGVTFKGYRGNAGQFVSGFNAGMRGRKGSPYEGGHRVPCFIRWPGGDLQSPREIQQLTAHLDLLPTLIDWCGLKRPPGVEFDGTSLAPLIEDPNENWPERTLFAHHQELPRPEKWRFCSVMTDRWRLLNGNELYDMSVDPGQKQDVAGDHTAVVKRLRGQYEAWWTDIAQRFDEYSEAIVGSDQQNPTRLTCFEWHSSSRWWQKNVQTGFYGNGFWALHVAQAGLYEITLRRWPEEVDLPISTAAEGGKAILATQARIKIGAVDQSSQIAPAAHQVKFAVRLKPGKTRLKTWLVDEKGNTCGAYYASIERVEP